MLKVLFVINSLGRSGTERSLAEMLPYLVQAEIQPQIVYFNSYSQGVEQEVKAQGFSTRRIAPHSLLARIRALRQLIQDERPQLVHTALFDANLAGRLAAYRQPVPVMSSLVNTSYTELRRQDPNLKAGRWRMIQAIDGWTARHLTTHFHAVSHAVKKEAIETLGVASHRVTVVERGRNPTRLGQPGRERRQQARVKLGLQQKDKVLVNVGRQEFQKGQIFLLQAMTQLTHKWPTLKLLIAGRDGNASAELNNYYRQAKLNEQVHFLGHRDDVPDILAAADLFVFPSLYEGMPGAVIEAMALGLPIIASDIAPNREVAEAERNALFVEPMSASQLATAIDQLLADPDCAEQYGKESRQRFEKYFTLEQSAARMIDLYQRVAEMQR
jgi:glycosyltransferase involved in cell wall biosynthesis